MLSKSIANLSFRASGIRSFSNSAALQNKVSVLGAAGGIGQPLSLLLKLEPDIKHLSLYDIVRTPGVAADISHVSTPAKVTGHVGKDQLGEALQSSNIVVIPAGVPRKPGMTRDDLFNTNASIVRDLVSACAVHCPEAHILIIANPVNSTVPIAAEVLKKQGVYNPRRLFGVTSLDVVRARTFVAENQNLDVNQVHVDVIGGHAGTTILPLLSQVKGVKFTQEDIEKLSHRISFGGDEVVKAKDGEGSATLSMAYAGVHFTKRLMAALRGESNVVECTFVESKVASTPFFSSPVLLGKEGVEEVRGFGKLSDFEKKLYDEMIPTLTSQIEKGVKFANQS